MKDSGIKWIGKIPENWETVPIYTCASEITQKNSDLKEKRALKFTYGNIVDKNNFNVDEDPALVETASNYLIVRPNDIVINGLNLNYDFVTQRVGMVNNHGIITSAYIGIRPNQEVIIPKYLLYLFKTYDAEKAFHNMGGGVRKILNYSELKKEKIILPSLSQQQTIVALLDKNCTKIDNISTKIQKEINTLQEYRKSVIARAVTKGLDDNVLMKDSEIEWIGEIPESWETAPIYTCTSEITQKNSNLKEKRALKFTYGNIVDKNNFNIDKDPSLTKIASNYLVVKPNDIVINGLNLNYDFVTQRVGMVNNHGIITSAYIGIRSNQNKVIPKYLLYLFKTYDAEKAFHNMGGGVRKILNYSELKKEKIILPSLSKQKAIVSFLDVKILQIEKVILQKKRQLLLLSNYKKSLIFEYTTGKRQVPSNVGEK